MKHYCKNGLLDRRFRVNKGYGVKEQQFWTKYGALIISGILGTLAGIILGSTLWRAYHQPIIDPRGRGEVKIVKEVLADDRFCDTPIKCIRDVGEELGKSNQDIMTMIRVAKCESTMNPEAVNVNRNKSVDRGLLQINSVHKGLSNKDAFDYEKNIRYAWKLHDTQGFRPWVCWRKVK